MYRTIKEDCINLERLSWTTLIQTLNPFCKKPGDKKARSVKDSISAPEKLALSPSPMKEISETETEWRHIVYIMLHMHLYTNICVERKFSIFIMDLIFLLTGKEQWFNLFQTMTLLDWYVDISKQLMMVILLYYWYRKSLWNLLQPATRRFW